MSKPVLRFLPDYGGGLPLWGAAAIGDEVLPRRLRAGLLAWVAEWDEFHICGLPDVRKRDWVMRGRKLHRRTQRVLKPWGVAVVTDFEAGTH